MRTRCGLNDPAPGPSFEGPFPPGNGSSAVAGAAAGTGWSVPLIAANDHWHLRRQARLAGPDCGGSGGVAKRLFERQTCDMGNRPRIEQAVLHRQAQVAVLAGLLRGDDIDALVEAVASADIPGWFTPDVAVLELAMTALDLTSIPGSEPLQYEGLRERYLPEVEFRRRAEHRNSQYALYATACMRGGLQPDLLNDTGWWQTRLWIYAVYATVIYSRAAAARRSTTVEQVPHDLAARQGSSRT